MDYSDVDEDLDKYKKRQNLNKTAANARLPPQPTSFKERGMANTQGFKKDLGYTSDSEKQHDLRSKDSTEVEDFMHKYRQNVVLESSPEGDDGFGRPSIRAQRMADEIQELEKQVKYDNI